MQVIKRFPNDPYLYLEDIEVTPQTITKILGGPLSFIQIAGDFGMFCLLDQTGKDLTFVIQDVEGNLTEMCGPVVFVILKDGKPAPVPDDLAVILNNNLPTMENGEQFLLVAGLYNDLSLELVEAESAFKPYTGEITEFDISKARLAYGADIEYENIEECFKVDGNALYFVTESCAPIYIRELN